MDVVIRKAALADLDGIAEIENASFDSDRFSRRQFAYLISRAKGSFYVATRSGVIVGYISLLAGTRNFNARIYNIAVLPDFRGRGIARALVGKAKEYALAEGKTLLSLEVRQDNVTAIKLYESCGFVISSVKQAYYCDGADGWRMELEL